MIFWIVKGGNMTDIFIFNVNKKTVSGTNHSKLQVFPTNLHTDLIIIGRASK